MVPVSDHVAGHEAGSAWPLEFVEAERVPVERDRLVVVVDGEHEPQPIDVLSSVGVVRSGIVVSVRSRSERRAGRDVPGRTASPGACRQDVRPRARPGRLQPVQHVTVGSTAGDR